MLEVYSVVSHKMVTIGKCECRKIKWHYETGILRKKKIHKLIDAKALAKAM